MLIEQRKYFNPIYINIYIYNTSSTTKFDQYQGDKEKIYILIYMK